MDGEDNDEEERSLRGRRRGQRLGWSHNTNKRFSMSRLTDKNTFVIWIEDRLFARIPFLTLHFLSTHSDPLVHLCTVSSWKGMNNTSPLLCHSINDYPSSSFPPFPSLNNTSLSHPLSTWAQLICSNPITFQDSVQTWLTWGEVALFFLSVRYNSPSDKGDA